MGKEYFVISHWSTLLENFNASPTQFYEQVESAIRQRQMPDIEISRTQMSESWILSDKREYLTVERSSRTFDICAAPFGNGFFVSWWLSYSLNFLQRIFLRLSRIPIIGFIFLPAMGDVTFYQQDTTKMFQTSVHSALLEVIDQITKTKGLKTLSEAERKPIMSEFYQPKSLRR